MIRPVETILGVGTKVRFAGKFVKGFSNIGVIEEAKYVDISVEPPDPACYGCYGIRNVNGNFHWVDKSKVKRFGDY